MADCDEAFDLADDELCAEDVMPLEALPIGALDALSAALAFS